MNKKRLWKAAWSYWRYVDAIESPFATGHESWYYDDCHPMTKIPPLMLGVAFQAYRLRSYNEAVLKGKSHPFWMREINNNRVPLNKIQDIAAKLGYGFLLTDERIRELMR